MARFARGAGALLTVLVLAAFALRFVGLSLAPFIQDEPLLLAAALQEARTGHFLAASPLVGTQGLPYGPVPAWFYAAVQLALGPSPLRAIAAMCAVVTLAQLTMCVALARAVARAGGSEGVSAEGGPAAGARDAAAFGLAFGAIGLCVASSPSHFFWARLAWDNQLVTAAAACAVALLAKPSPLTTRRSALLGAALGAGLGAHLMMAPLALLAGLAACLRVAGDPRRVLRTALAIAVPALLVLSPYLGFLARAGLHAAPPGRNDVPFVARLSAPARTASPEGIAYFFDGDWPDFLRWTGGDAAASRGGAAAARGGAAASRGGAAASTERGAAASGDAAAETFGWLATAARPDFAAVLTALWAALAAAGIAAGLAASRSTGALSGAAGRAGAVEQDHLRHEARGSSAPIPASLHRLHEPAPASAPLSLFSLAAALAYPAFYAWRGLPLEPHYQSAASWLVPAGLACALAVARARFRSAFAALCVLAAALGAVQVGVNGGWLLFIDQRGGTRGLHYSTPVGAQEEALRTACGAAAREIWLANETVILPASLRYLAQTLPACAGKTLGLCGPRCAPAPIGAAVFTLRYAADRGGAVEVQRAR